jgi:hypothetical protein
LLLFILPSQPGVQGRQDCRACGKKELNFPVVPCETGIILFLKSEAKSITDGNHSAAHPMIPTFSREGKPEGSGGLSAGPEQLQPVNKKELGI